MNDLLGKWVVAKTAQGNFFGEGRVKGYCDAPTVQIETDDGEKIWWRADLCEVVEDELANYLASVQDRLMKHYGVVELDIRFRKLNEPWMTLNKKWERVAKKGRLV